MATIMVRVSEGQKELWVGAAHDERVSLSEWIRRRCEDGLGAGVREIGSESEKGGQPEERASGVSPSTGPMAPARYPASPAPRPFRVDPKGGRRGLGSGEVSAGSPPVAGAGSPEPSPLDVVSPDAAQGVRVGKASFRPDPKKKP